MSTSLFVSLLLSLATKEVLTWTIDLPEVRKYFFEKYSDDERTNLVERNGKSFDNIHGDSPLTKEYGIGFDHNLEHNDEGNINGGKEYENEIHRQKYASGYEYHSYMEKKVMDVVHNGSAYLEGLSLAIQNYTQVLQSCSIYNLTASRQNNESSTWLPQNETPPRSNGTLEMDERCERTTRASEHVRRLAELALWAARELQDRDYAQHYQKQTSEQEKEENELLLRLAWFLDRLAHVTGFEPSAQPTAPPTPRARLNSTSAVPFAMLPVPEDVKNSLMECMSGNSSEPAYERCRYPLPLPDSVRTLLNISDTPPSSSEINTEGPTTPPSLITNTVSTPSTSELLIPSESRHLSNFPPVFTAVKSVKKRSVDNPLLNVVKYYVKHKLWTNSNAQIDHSEEFDLDNNLVDVKSIQKRSIVNKKSKIHLPENPMQDLSKYLKHKNGVNYVKDMSQAEKIRLYLDKLRHKDSLTAKNSVPKMQKSFKRVQKRSVEHETKFKPRVAENPMKDISFYIKNKPGTNYEDNLVQAAQVRAGLEQVFQTGNIEVIRRYGANYNPAVPNPLINGIMRSMADV